jgi:Na+-translocating ferredoxin:NAD+ oxidoreductase RnfD subunit
VSAAALALPPRQLYRVARSPKGITLAVLGLFAVLAAAAVGSWSIVGNLLLAVLAAASIDLAVGAVRRDELVFPDGAILTGMIVAFVMRPQEPAAAILLAVIVALASKHLLRTRASNIFNPAAVGLVFAALALGSGESWWGALPDFGLAGALIVLAAGAFITNRINKAPMVIAFLSVYFGLFTIAALFGHASAVAEVFRTPDIQAALFLALFMLDDPPTSPVRYEDQVVYGIMVATLAYLIFMVQGAVYYLPLALLAGNAWESLRRVYIRGRRHTSPA